MVPIHVLDEAFFEEAGHAPVVAGAKGLSAGEKLIRLRADGKPNRPDFDAFPPL
jgi:hypothetical protein